MHSSHDLPRHHGHGVVKSREGYYVLPEEMRLQRMVSELVEEVHVAGNMVVVKTFSGGAAGVSAALDKASLRGALGTVAATTRS